MIFQKYVTGWGMEMIVRRMIRMALVSMWIGNFAWASPYDEVEFDVRPSPTAGQALAFAGAETVVDFAVSPFGPEVFVLWHDADTGYRMRVWSLDAGDVTAEWEVPPDVTPQGLVPHPAKRQLFVAGQQSGKSVVLRVEAYQGHWQATPIFRTSAQILNLVAAPRPFQTHWTSETEFEQEYRLFFGVQHADGDIAINSVTENGLREYQVLGPEDHYITFPEANTEEQPTPMFAPAALPQAVHPDVICCCGKTPTAVFKSPAMLILIGLTRPRSGRPRVAAAA